jgi:hypothetical protein
MIKEQRNLRAIKRINKGKKAGTTNLLLFEAFRRWYYVRWC